ncbi:MAG TPA: Rieske (2Fe-2S) protein, partial [Chitinophaga sp.]|uniref:QcrA and Rieske domain-containing protein n=1 Tax=Chitinophaga sp. TaxID=1869181 RepID=UPI002C624148
MNSSHWKRDFPINSLETSYITRREFARFLCLLSGGFTAGSAYVALRARFFSSEKISGEHCICNLNSVPPGGTRTFMIPGSTLPYILIHLENGLWRAYEQKCTHLSCAVFYQPGTGRIACPCHDGYFDALTGAPLAG